MAIKKMKDKAPFVKISVENYALILSMLDVCDKDYYIGFTYDVMLSGGYVIKNLQFLKQKATVNGSTLDKDGFQKFCEGGVKDEDYVGLIKVKSFGKLLHDTEYLDTDFKTLSNYYSITLCGYTDKSKLEFACYDWETGVVVDEIPIKLYSKNEQLKDFVKTMKEENITPYVVPTYTGTNYTKSTTGNVYTGKPSYGAYDPTSKTGEKGELAKDKPALDKIV